MSRIKAIVFRQFFLIKGSFARLMPIFFWIMVDMILWGFISTYLDKITSYGYNFLPTLLGAVLLWDFFTRVMYGMTIAFFEDVWSKNFLNLFVSPIKIWEYLAGLIITSIVTSILGLLVMLIIATFIFGLSFAIYGILLFPFILILFLFGICLGIMSCAVVFRFGPPAEWLIWPVPLLISPFVGVFYPIDTLPHWMQYISSILPPTYVFEAMRAIVAMKSLPYLNLITAVILAIIYLILASFFFTYIYRWAFRNGVIARLSVENLG
ncbi:MAG: ABC transporter permease [Thermodesulfovibrionales bacterium]